MAYTESDLATVQQAIASKELSVRFPDGSQVTYRNTSELLAAEARILQDLRDQGVAQSRATYVAYSRG
ncbi:MAG: phage head-tail joining protein [Alphaproteobacteria bacterium]